MALEQGGHAIHKVFHIFSLAQINSHKKIFLKKIYLYKGRKEKKIGRHGEWSLESNFYPPTFSKERSKKEKFVV